MAKKLYVTRNCSTTIRGKRVDLEYGQEAPGNLSPGATTSMLNAGLLTSDEPPQATPEPDDGQGDGEPADWRATRVDAIEAIDKNVVEALAAEGIETLGGVVEYAKANNGLQKINGIGVATEKQLQEVVATHAAADQK